jgi:hypothetical protein
VAVELTAEDSPGSELDHNQDTALQLLHCEVADIRDIQAEDNQQEGNQGRIVVGRVVLHCLQVLVDMEFQVDNDYLDTVHTEHRVVDSCQVHADNLDIVLLDNEMDNVMEDNDQVVWTVQLLSGDERFGSD